VKQILVLGAGQSAPYCIAYLLEHAAAQDWFITVGDIDLDLARRRINGHPRGSAIRFDINDSTLRATQFEHADVVVSMLPPHFMDLIAWECVNHGCHMISVSYRDKAVRDLDVDAHRHGLLLLCEMGLDPGIDHMSAISLIRRVREDGGRIGSFCSYGSGIPAPDQPQNPMRYLITWNPRNVAMAGEKGAQYMENGKIKIVAYPHVFHHTWTVEVEGVGTLEAYPNRDSLSYMNAFGLKDVHTMIRGTLRYPGWSETWSQIVCLGLPNENARIPHLADRTYREVVEMFLPLNVSGPKIETRLARFLGISPTGGIIENMRWLGLFSDEKIGCEGDTAVNMLVHALNRKMPLTDDLRDIVVLVHEMEVEYPDQDRSNERITSTLVAKGEAGGFTAMAKTVGLPAAIAVKLLLRDELPLTGSHIPTHPSIYEPILREIADEGLRFTEEREVMSDE